MEQKRSFRKIDNALCQSINQLWDDCFGDLPLLQQSVLKAYGTRSSKEAFFHKNRDEIDFGEWKDINVDKNHFALKSEQVVVAQKVVDDIVKEFKKGKSRTARYLRHFLKDKKIKVSICKDLSYEAYFEGYNPETKEIYLDLCAGCFCLAETNQEMCNKDALAVIIGHEIGHAIEKLNRSFKCEAKTVFSNSWEIENFCDMMGFRLATDAGYTLKPNIKMMQKGIKEHREPKQPNPHPPLKNRLELAKFCQKIFVKDNRCETLFDDKVTAVEWNAEKDLWMKLRNLAAKKRN